MHSFLKNGLPQGIGIDHKGGLLVLCALKVLLHQLRSYADDVLTLPVLDQVEGLKRIDNVRLGDGRDPTQVGNAKGAPKVAQDFQQDPRPVRPANFITISSLPTTIIPVKSQKLYCNANRSSVLFLLLGILGPSYRIAELAIRGS